MFPLWLVPAVIWLFAGAVTLYDKITEDSLKETVKEKVPEAFKIRIEEAKKNKVDVGIYGKQNKHLENLSIESKEGVSSSIRKGQEYYV